MSDDAKERSDDASSRLKPFKAVIIALNLNKIII